MKMLFAVLILSMSGGIVQTLSAETVLVVNKNNPITSLTKAQLKKILMGQQAKWPSGTPVSVLLTAPGSPDRKVAIADICGMTENEYSTWFLKANFQGQSVQAPKTMPTGKAIVQLTQLVAGAVAFVSQDDVTPGVKVITVGEE